MYYEVLHFPTFSDDNKQAERRTMRVITWAEMPNKVVEVFCVIKEWRPLPHSFIRYFFPNWRTLRGALLLCSLGYLTPSWSLRSLSLLNVGTWNIWWENSWRIFTWLLSLSTIIMLTFPLLLNFIFTAQSYSNPIRESLLLRSFIEWLIIIKESLDESLNEMHLRLKWLFEGIC